MQTGKRIAISTTFALSCFCCLMLIGNASATRSVVEQADCLVEPSVTASIGSAVPGLIAETRFNRGDYVNAGEELASLESSVEEATRDYANAVARLKTALELREVNAAFGKRTEQRNQMLFDSDSVSSQVMDQVRTEASIARLQVQQEQENLALALLEAQRAEAVLKRRKIFAPYDGAVVKRFKTAGEYVEGEPIFKIARLDPLHVEVVLPLNQLGMVEVGMQGIVSIPVPGVSGRDLVATVLRIDPVADAASGTYGVLLELPNPDLTIPSGVRCSIDLISHS